MSPRRRMFRDAADLRRLADWLESQAPAELPDDTEDVYAGEIARGIALTHYALADRLDREAASAREYARIYAPRIP